MPLREVPILERFLLMNKQAIHASTITVHMLTSVMMATFVLNVKLRLEKLELSFGGLGSSYM